MVIGSCASLRIGQRSSSHPADVKREKLAKRLPRYGTSVSKSWNPIPFIMMNQPLLGVRAGCFQPIRVWQEPRPINHLFNPTLLPRLAILRLVSTLVTVPVLRYFARTVSRMVSR